MATVREVMTSDVLTGYAERADLAPDATLGAAWRAMNVSASDAVAHVAARG